MRLWVKASGALKDTYSIWVAKLSPSGPCRNPDLEIAIIKATSHNEPCMDYKNVQRVFKWLRTSPLYLKPLLYTVSMRMEKTRSWVVALKGLMLTHGVFCFDYPAMKKMGRLPFDLSHFSDVHVNPNKAWLFNAFVRSYFAYLDQKSAFVRLEATKETKRGSKEKEEAVMEELQDLEKFLGLIDLLLQIKPSNPNMNVVLILEVMDCVMDEVLEVYDKFSMRVHRVVSRIIDMGGKEEARVGLDFVRKVELQGGKISMYFDFCRDIGVINVSECPEIVRIDEKDIHELISIRDGGVSEKKNLKFDNNNNYNDNNTIVVYEGNNSRAITTISDFKTVITDQWEVFDDVMDSASNDIHNPDLDVEEVARQREEKRQQQQEAQQAPMGYEAEMLNMRTTMVTNNCAINMIMDFLYDFSLHVTT
ncbi:putative clathrin assembly protein At1g25240 [Glycine max]|uniref:putative clathrin assembly protein At1g25240 n=1 Tax=Glycine max TaxID=3847 RepID=UPI000719354D|nr:putative clathrin assembly protein At1g25240 [Glycine max]|eukprot:XP_003528380.2 putative clathrin assembly protein At1g25240 [Glycine max]